ncbi:hypothetical protein OLMES_2734 [Oleiphilus messinensis]|uniref:EF-hand domain-containing protein n=1 Tax=Oleiphilus messinensis TaxID=141451 RepID=A0A1Y0IBL5_9GAMM|nr:EF-hand domain-containing protein [Oleiphilus messinensis]ARU56784.1 hypothetical protein OLMES_2734 [Oleiphilus messinensis]
MKKSYAIVIAFLLSVMVGCAQETAQQQVDRVNEEQVQTNEQEDTDSALEGVQTSVIGQTIQRTRSESDYVTEAEMGDAGAMDSANESLEKQLEKPLEKAFAYLDANNDKALSLAESEPNQIINQHFEKIDLDTNGSISLAEFIQYTTEPTSAGAYTDTYHQ